MKCLCVLVAVMGLAEGRWGRVGVVWGSEFTVVRGPVVELYEEAAVTLGSREVLAGSL